ncbi:MAG: VCBS repeat-containing protein [Planctomycetota bacterium]
MAKLHTRAVSALSLLALAAPASAQLVRNTADIPTGTFNRGLTENVDFADVDLDGDFDAIFANGGDSTRDQNRIWINMGGLQGGTTGVFQDMTAARMPAINDQSRDIEFVDFDNDGDPDIYVSNSSQIAPDTNRWWVNQGGAQGGTAGFYVDQTLTRWVGLGAPGSSISAQYALANGGFVDWSCDCDFADLDNDGDLDLIHSSYGDQFGGMTPSRLFLNDGAGHFSEFNPSGIQLFADTIPSGTAGIWCEGNQQTNTSNTSGAFCDISAVTLDVDAGDIDGDFDLDILLGDRNDPPRMFANRLDGSNLASSLGGALGFRDVTSMVFPAGYSTGDGHYEQEMGDMDGDGDLDIYGLNWRVQFFTFTDQIYPNNGNGTFSAGVTLPSSGDDDNEADWFDYDGDGDLDIIVANFTKGTTADRLYRNETTTANTPVFVSDFGNITQTSSISLDIDACDVDGDGDYDLFAASDANAPQVYFENTFDVPDTTAPLLPRIEQAANRAPGAAPTVVRVHVYDNAPYYITYFNTSVLKYRVDNGPIESVPMLSSGGQVFRGALPGELAGTITYWAESSDKYGNTGTSASRSFEAFLPGTIGGGFCAANVNSTGSAAQIFATGNTSLFLNSATLHADGLPLNSFGFYLASLDRGFVTNPGGSQGNLCLGGSIGRYVGAGQIQNSGALGATSLALDVNAIPTPNGLVAAQAGESWHFTYWYRDANPMPTSNFTGGVSITFQ